MVFAGDKAGRSIQMKISIGKYLGFLHFPRAACQGTHPSQQFTDMEGFYQIIIRAAVQPVNPVVQSGHSGNNDHRDLDILSPHGFYDGQSVNDRQHTVYNGKVIAVVLIQRIQHSRFPIA